MDGTSAARQRIIRASRLAREHMERIRSKSGIGFEEFHRELSGFILSKYMLWDEDCSGMSFDDIARLSLARSMKISKELVEEFDLAKSCDGISSLIAKKVLLLRAIERELELQLPAGETARAETIEDISRLAYAAFSEKNNKD